MNARQRSNLAAAFRAMRPCTARGKAWYTVVDGPGRGYRQNRTPRHQAARECARRVRQGLAPRKAIGV
jgi:hypothetical protein